MGAWGALVGAGGAGLLACSLALDTGGLSEGPTSAGTTNEGGASDAPIGRDAAVGPAGEASTLVPLPDAGPDAAGPFCASLTPPPTFCVDFDDEPYDRGLVVTQGKAGTLAADPTTFRSAPRSLVSSVPAGTTTGSTQTTLAAGLGRDLGMAPRALRLELDLRVDAADPTTGVTIAAVRFGVENRYVLNLLVKEKDALIIEEIRAPGKPAQFPGTALAQHPTIGVWTHVVLTASFKDRDVTVAFDNAAPIHHAMPADAVTGSVIFAVGAIYYGSDSVVATTVRHDNVVLRLE